MLQLRTLSTGVALAYAMLLLPASVRAQLVVDDAHGLVGKEVAIALRMSTTDSTGLPLQLSGQLLLGNSTVFYPQRFVAVGGDSLLESSLVAMNDSVYSFSVTLRNAGATGQPTDTLVLLAGEALAGSDSVCILRFSNIRLDGISLANTSGKIVTQSIGPPLPYIRFATLEMGYPNPLRRGQTGIWGYRIDRLSDVQFIIYSMIGQELDIVRVGPRSIGAHIFTYTPGLTQPSGTYWIRMVTNTGIAERPFQIVR